jgi:hypothetical protein
LGSKVDRELKVAEEFFGLAKKRQLAFHAGILSPRR